MDNGTYYYANFIFNCIFLVIFIIYFILFITYALCSMRKKYSPQIVFYWLEYLVFNIILLTYITTYLVYLSHIKAKISSGLYEISCSDPDISTYCLLINLLIILISFEIFYFLIGDSIQSILICIGIVDIVKIKQPDVKALRNKFADNYAMNTSNPRRILILHGGNLACVIIICFVYVALFPSMKDSFKKDDASLLIVAKGMRIIHLIGMIGISLIVYTLKFYKQRLMDTNYYSSNLIMQATYNLNVAKIILYNDFLTYKSIIDFAANVPTLLFICLRRFSLTSLIVTYTCFFAYFIFGGGIFAHFDKTQKVSVAKAIKKFFLFHRMKFDFGTKEKAKLFEEYLLDLDSTSNLFNDFSLSRIESEIFDVNDIDSDENNKKSIKGNQNNFISYYTIFNSLYQFFDENQKAYSTASKIITSLYKYSIETMYQEDDDLLDEFNKNYSNTKASIEFIFEAYNSDSMIKLYQLSQIDINDILASLNPENNRDIAQTFTDKTSCDKAFNTYTSHDSLVYYELYDTYGFPLKEMRSFCEEYIQYLDQQNRKNEGTYLPLLLGIFKLSYLSYESYIVLYKNPLAFTPYIEMSYWLKLTLSDSQEKINMSSTTSNAIDLSVIDFKNNVKFNEEKVTSIKNQIESDLNIIKSFSFLSYCRLNVFVLKESKSYKTKFIESFDDLYGKDSLLSGDSHQGINVIEHDHKSKESFDSMRNISIRKEYGTNTICSFDVLYSKQLDNQSFICKIFISDIFRIRINNISPCCKGKKNTTQSMKTNQAYYLE